jgi:hypothetical protein
MKRVVLPTLLLLTLAVAAPAQHASTRARALLLQAETPTELRSLLLTYADSAAAWGDRAGSGEALYYAGLSYQRAGLLDSAIACHRLAFERADTDRELLELVDQLLLRRHTGDLVEAIERLTPAARNPELHPPLPIRGRLAWGLFLQGHTDSAAAAFAPIKRHLISQPEWRYRMARVAIAREDYRSTVDLLLPNAVLSRNTDQDVLGMLDEVGNATGMLNRIQGEIVREMRKRDRKELALADSLGGRLTLMRASDGFPLAGLLLPAAETSSSTAPPLAAIVLMAPGDTLASGDSLAVALHRHGLTTLLLHLRGSGGSVAPSCPTPDSWFDREQALQSRVALDVQDALQGLLGFTPVDTTRYIVVGVGPAATMAVEAATLDPRVKALLLVSPAPALVDRGVTRARLARLRLPVFFQMSPDEFDATYETKEAFYQACDRAASRVVDSTVPGVGLAQFRAGPGEVARFLSWLDATLDPERD